MSHTPAVSDQTPPAADHTARARFATAAAAQHSAARLRDVFGFHADRTPPTPPDVYDQQNVVLMGRLNRRAAVAKVFWPGAAGCATAERRALGRFRDLGLPVPRLLAAGRLDLPGQPRCPALLLERLPGTPLSLVLAEAPGWLLRAAGTQLGRLLAAQAHAERFPPTPRGDPRVGVVQAGWQRLADRAAATLREELGVPAALLDRMAALAGGLSDPPDLGWVTHDWRLRHLLWHDGRLTGLVDLEYAKAADSTIELANLLHDLMLNMPARPRRQTAAALLDACQPHHGTVDAERLRFYLARQACNHAAVKHWQGIRDARLQHELRLFRRYLDAADVLALLTAPAAALRPTGSSPPRPTHWQRRGTADAPAA